MNQIKLLKIARKTNGRCFYCNGPGEEVDHFISKKKWEEWDCEQNSKLKGKRDDIDNLFLTCKKCNRAKRDKAPADFMNNFYEAWDRYYRANQRIGLCEEVHYDFIF